MTVGDTTATSAAFDAIVEEMGLLRDRMVEHPEFLGDPQGRLEAHRWVFSITQVALDCFVWADSAAPRFVDIVGSTKKWGGDNADAFYQHTPIDPHRTYRVSGYRGDAVYLSLTVYGGPDDGRYSERIVGSINDRDLAVDPDGRFEFWIGPEAPGPDAGPGIRTEPDAVVGITRDYLADPTTGRRTTWRIESLDPAVPYRLTDDDLARRMTAALTFMRDQAAIVPIPVVGDPNTFQDPYPVPTATFGWAAGDAAYAMGNFRLGSGDALVVEGRSPECAFWNLCLWNPLLHTYDYDRGRVTINGHQATYRDDGSWVVVISDSPVDHPNAIETQGHPSGRIWVRWFLPDETPPPLRTRVVAAAEVTPEVRA